MGVVFRGRAPDGRAVAIKVLLKPGSHPAAARFDRERRLLEGLGEAEGFVPLLDAGMGPRGPYLVMPFVTGGTLRDRVAQGPLGIEETIAWGEALATAMGRAHALGIVHRDLKPENILFTEPGDGGRPLIADLGLAKHFAAGEGTQSVSLSKTGEMKGTAGYMAPEQINDSKAVGPPADVFSLGAILYECFTGRTPFGGDSIHSRLAKVAAGEFEPIRRVRRDVPRGIARVIERALAPTPAERYASGAALAEALASRGANERSRFPVALAAVGACVLVAGGALALLILRPTRPPEPSVAPTPSPIAVPTPSPKKTGHELPPFAAGLSKTARTRLASVLGDVAWKLPAGAGGSIGFLPDGQRFAAGTSNAVVLGDLATGLVTKTIPVSIGGVHSIDPSPDGKRLLCTGGDRLSVIVDLASGAVVARLEGQYRQIYSGHFFPDGQRVVTASDDDGTVRVWDAATGRQQWSARGHNFVWTCAVSPDGQQVLTGGVGDGGAMEVDKGWDIERVPEAEAPPGEKRDPWAIRLWDAGTGKLVRSLVGHRHFAHSVAFSPDGTRVASGGWDLTVRLWDPATGALLRTLEGHTEPIRALSMVSATRILSSSSSPNDPVLCLWDTTRPPGRELVRTFRGHRAGVGAVAVSMDGKRALSVADRTARLWDLESGAELSTVSGHPGSIVGLALVPGGKRLVTAGTEGTIRSWEVAASREAAVVDALSRATCFALAPDGTRALSGHEDGSVRLWDLARGTGRALAGHKGRVGGVAFVPGSSRALSAGVDGVLRVWDISTLAEGDALQGSPEPLSLSVSADGKRVLCVGRDAVTIWDLANGIVSGRHTGAITAAVLAPDGSSAIVASADGDISVWAGGDVQVRPFANGPIQTAVVVSPTGTLAASAGVDGVLQLWDLATLKPVDRRELPGERVASLAFAQGGDQLAVGLERGAALVFDVGPGK
jgi:WD40 repeat protein